MKPQGSKRNAIKRGNDSGLDFGVLQSLVGYHLKQAQISVFYYLELSIGLLGQILIRPLISQTPPCYGAPA